MQTFLRRRRQLCSVRHVGKDSREDAFKCSSIFWPLPHSLISIYALCDYRQRRLLTPSWTDICAGTRVIVRGPLNEEKR